MSANWWDALIPEPPEDSDRTRQLAQLANWRNSLPAAQQSAPGGPTWDEATEELEAALGDPDPHRWEVALQLVWAVGRLEAILGLLQTFSLPGSSR
ncbi:MAG: hypothetical protein WA695_01240 [Candidatus Dormiibacterota bacterium]